LLAPALKSLVNVIRLTITQPNHNIRNVDILCMVSNFSHLNHLTIQYGYPFSSNVLTGYGMPSLTHLIVRYSHVVGKLGFKRLFNFVLKLVSSSPHLESLTLSAENTRAPVAGTNEFVQSLGKVHGALMKLLCIPDLYLKPHALRQIGNWFPHLEELSVAVGPTVLFRIIELIPNMEHLSKLSLKVPRYKGAAPYFPREEAVALLQQGPPRLRRICVNEDHWVAMWMYDNDSHSVYFGVCQENV